MVIAFIPSTLESESFGVLEVKAVIKSICYKYRRMLLGSKGREYVLKNYTIDDCFVTIEDLLGTPFGVYDDCVNPIIPKVSVILFSIPQLFQGFDA